jgi:hypothetical protein
MVELCHERVQRASDDELREFVRSALADRADVSARLRSVNRGAYEYNSSFAIEIVDVELENGGHIPLIFKDLSPLALLDGARQIRRSELYRPQREIRVYREILAAASLGTASYYGSVIDEECERYWLLLEKVAGDELYTIGELSVWCAVARWLARAHSRFAESLQDRQSGALLQYDERFFCDSIDRAIAEVEKRAVAAEDRAGRVRQLWTTSRAAMAAVAKLPRTLIHGDFYPSNVLVSAEESDLRICAVDWELAGVGPGLLDLAALVSGKWSERQRQELARAYFDELGDSQTSIRFREFNKALLNCRLLVAVGWLGWSSDWQPPEAHRHDWFADALGICEQIQELR